MEAGLAAPSGCNRQTTSIVAVDDSDLLEQIRPLIKRVGATGATNKNGGPAVGPVLGPCWVQGCFVGSACRTMASFC